MGEADTTHGELDDRYLRYVCTRFVDSYVAVQLAAVCCVHLEFLKNKTAEAKTTFVSCSKCHAQRSLIIQIVLEQFLVAVAELAIHCSPIRNFFSIERGCLIKT